MLRATCCVQTLPAASSDLRAVGGTSQEFAGRSHSAAGTIAPVAPRSDAPLVSEFDALLFDLDGVLYIGELPVPFAAVTLDEVAKRFGTKRTYITNNASRTPEQVVQVLAGVGVPATLDEIVTSAQVAAAHLAAQLPEGSAVLVIGGEGLVRALEANGLRPVHTLQDQPAAVVQGFHPDVGWRDLAMAAEAVSAGLPWVASNADLTIPTATGIAPGNGTLIAAVSTATGIDPVVVGKPHTPAVFAAIERCGSERPIIIGDRLDTDIEAANRAEIDSLLVMTGVTDLETLIAADAIHRPSHVCLDLRALLEPYEHPEFEGESVACGGWEFFVHAGGVRLVQVGDSAAPGLRALSVACWRSIDNGYPLTELVTSKAVVRVGEAVSQEITDRT